MNMEWTLTRTLGWTNTKIKIRSVLQNAPFITLSINIKFKSLKTQIKKLKLKPNKELIKVLEENIDYFKCVERNKNKDFFKKLKEYVDNKC